MDSIGQQGGIYRYLFFKPFKQTGDAKSGMSQYDYWLDNDYANRKTAVSAIVDSPLSIDLSTIPAGVHFFNFRAKDSIGQLGGMYRYLFFKPYKQTGDAKSGMSQYDYWLDNDYANRKTAVSATVDSPLSIDLSTIPAGVHFFNFRAKDSIGQLGGFYRYLFFKPYKQTGDAKSGMSQYDYWLDNDYANRKTAVSATIDSPLSIDLSTIPAGVHFFNFRAKDSIGQQGGIYRYLFYKPYVRSTEKDLTDKLSHIQLWIDNNRDNVKTLDVSNDTIISSMNIADLPKGDHLLRVYGYTNDGECCLFYSFDFNAPHLPVVPTPVITHSGNTITIADGEGVDSDSVIVYRYTLDGTTPTSKSKKYEGPFEVTRNDTLRVIGIQYAHENSKVAQLVIDWFKVAMPTTSQRGKTLTLSCSTPNSTIYYKIGDSEEQAYSSPIRLPSQQLVTAVGRRTGYNDSEPLLFQPRAVKSATPAITYDGRYLRIASSEEGVDIYYTADGTSPVNGLDVAEKASLYDGRITIDSLCTIHAVAIIDSMNVSDVLTYPVDYLYNGETTYIRKEGTLARAFEWNGGIDKIETLTVEGRLNSIDLDSLRNLPNIKHVDLSKATIVSAQIPTEAFEGSKMISFVSPATITSAGGRLFADCPRLAAVVWNADVALKDNSFEGVDNPNLLLYVKKSAYKPSGMTNVVVNGTAENIVLKDSVAGNTNFYCPQPFTATNISYTHEYKQQTAIGVTQGWETLALPFTVETITHETHGALLPFGGEGEGKPFWLMKLGEDGLKYVSTIEANQPYVLSMPNNPKVYAEEYNQNGKVTFAAKDADVPVTDPQDNSGVGMTLRPVYQQVGKSNGVYALNVGEAVDDNPEGSVFKRDYRDVRPFEVYLLHSDNASRVIALSRLGGGDGTTGIDDMLLRKDQNPDGNVRVYSLSGTLIKQGKRSEVIKNLPKGIYIVDNKKMVIK
ncbi:MAG: chitobiase/beta-hexosaminidase C-terminal domain-containing protein [Prevotella sp.]|nr:chitobiase/beta-hexosaminidase C-terminal domain-containing protein [Prevotella sp.]